MRPIPLPILFLLLSLSPLSAAYIAEYGFHLAPCEWCLYQRVPYALIAALSVMMMFLRGQKFFVWSILFLFVVELGLAITHVGIEQHWWTFESGCLSAVMENSVEAELARLKATPVVPCDKPAFLFLGLSMAAWNVVYSLMVIFLGVSSSCSTQRQKNNLGQSNWRDVSSRSSTLPGSKK